MWILYVSWLQLNTCPLSIFFQLFCQILRLKLTRRLSACGSASLTVDHTLHFLLVHPLSCTTLMQCLANPLLNIISIWNMVISIKIHITVISNLNLMELYIFLLFLPSSMSLLFDVLLNVLCLVYFKLPSSNSCNIGMLSHSSKACFNLLFICVFFLNIF